MILAFDTETWLIDADTGLAPPLVCASFAWRGPTPAPFRCLGVRHGVEGLSSVVLDAPSAIGVWSEVVSSTIAEGGVLIGANVAFDLAVMAAEAPATLAAVFEALQTGRVSDVQIRERLAANARGTLTGHKVSLADLVYSHLGADAAAEVRETKHAPDAWRYRYRELDGVPLDRWPAEAVDYPHEDARNTLRVWEAQNSAPAEIDGHPFRLGDRYVSEDREVCAAWALHLMALRGLRAEGPRVEALVAAWREREAAADGAALAGGWRTEATTGPRGGLKPARNSNKALRDVVTAALGAGAPRTAPSATHPAGQVKIDEETLLHAAEAPHAPGELRTYAEGLRARKMLAVWAPALRRASMGALVSRPTHLVATGRTSWSNPPLQQPPREGGVRECFVPRPGYLFCSVDYEIAELCALAQVCAWMGLGTTLRDAIADGVDIHCLTAATLVGRPYDEIRAGYLAGDKDTSAARQLAKAANFGLPGGLGARRLAMHIRHQTGRDVSDAEAETIRQAWRATWPDAASYLAKVSDILAYQDTFTARHPVSGRLRGLVGYTDGCNGFFQGLVADIGKAACWTLARTAYLAAPGEALHGTAPVLFLHDEILAEVPEAQAPEAAEAIAAIMIAAGYAHAPDVTWRAEPALMRRWHKGAKTVRDDAGRLVAWEPREA